VVKVRNLLEVRQEMKYLKKQIFQKDDPG
jgi:hypothetical protein